LHLTSQHIAEVAAFQHIINASDGAKIAKYLSRELMPRLWQTRRCISVAAIHFVFPFSRNFQYFNIFLRN
jgi:hypothetical protein